MIVQAGTVHPDGTLTTFLAVERRKDNAKGGLAADFRRARLGEISVILPTNMPRKPQLASDRDQAEWVDDRLENADLVTIAECHDGLARELRRRGLYVHQARHNPGANGNVIVSDKKFVSKTQFSVPYRAYSGKRIKLHVAVVVTKKNGVKCTDYAIHVPAPYRKFITGASPEQQRAFVQHIARRKASTRSVRISGDWNMKRDDVLRALQSVDKRWRYLGGRGVEMTFGLNVKKLGDSAINYGNKSDHHVTARVVCGVPTRGNR